MDRHIEKRKTPRVEQKLPIKVAEGDHCMVVETKNISASGVYFLTEKHLLPMSRVSVTLLMPTHSGKNAKVGCSGTVVRIIPTVAQGKTMYETAIFFDEITEKTKALLSRHIKGVLTHSTSLKINPEPLGVTRDGSRGGEPVEPQAKRVDGLTGVGK